MSATSRREFLAGAAAASAGVACATLNAAPPAAPISHDEMVAMDFINWPRHQESPAGPTRLAGLLYGLICVDAPEREALLPNATGVPNVRPHRARFWVLTSTIAGTNPFTGPDTGTDATGVLTYFSFATYRVSFAPITAAGTPALHPNFRPDMRLKWRNSRQHPWCHEKWVRSITRQTGRAMIDNTQRDDRALVRSRVELRGGSVSAVCPFTVQGQHGEWRSDLSGGRVVTAATTDSILWTRNYPRTTDRLAVKFANASGEKTVYLRMTATTGLLVAITHATDSASSDPTKMTDSTAFARLLTGNDPSAFPIPKLATLPNPDALGSSEDVHCEGGKP